VAELEDEPHKDLAPLFERIVEDVPPPKPLAKPATASLQDAGHDAGSRSLLGRILTGRIESGAHHRQPPDIKALNARRQGSSSAPASTKLLAFRGLARVPVERAEAGDIVAIAGLPTPPWPTRCATWTVDRRSRPSDRSADPGDDHLGQRQPLAGREGDKVQSRVIRERLLREAEGNVALKVTETGEKAISKWPAAANCSWAC
jgi:GTP-binding protein